MSGSARPPLTSLTSVAPASTAWRGDLRAHRVDGHHDVRRRRAPRRPGGRGAAPPATLGRSAPGRVDSPPTSTRSAPSAASARPCATAAAGSNQSPPSENESGVTLTTPMTHRPADGRGADRCGGRAGLAGHRPPPSTQAHRLGSGRGVAQLAADRGGDGAGAGLADAAHRHAQVLALDDDDDALRGCSCCIERVGDLGGQALLDLRAAREHVDQAGELGQAGDAAVPGGDVADVRDPVERHEVVLAGAVDLDVAHQDHLVVVDRRTWSAARRQASWSRPGERSPRRPGPPGRACRADPRGRGPRRRRCSSSRTAASARSWSTAIGVSSPRRGRPGRRPEPRSPGSGAPRRPAGWRPPRAAWSICSSSSSPLASCGVWPLEPFWPLDPFWP